MNGESGQETVESLVQMWADQDEQRGKDPNRVMPRHADWMNARVRLLDAVYRSQMEPVVEEVRRAKYLLDNALGDSDDLANVDVDEVENPTLKAHQILVAALSAFEKWSKP